ncbi:MAG: LptF/LptG family permease [Opitutae bacterium]|nr:LptF/LptG family permease [Opitutae bacterium]
MKILSRHMFFQLATAVLLSLALFIFVLVTGNVLKHVMSELANGRISLPTLFEIFGLISVSVIPYAMPLGILTGVLLVLGRMSSSNEILAMKAAGMNLSRIIAPILFIAFISVVISAYINCFWAPTATSSYRSMLKSTFRESPTNLIVPGELFTQFPGFSIYADKRKGETLENFWIWELDGSGNPQRTTHAEEATIRFVEAQGNDDEDSLKIMLKNAVTEERSREAIKNLSGTQLRFSGVAKAEIEVSLGKILSSEIAAKSNRKLRWFTLPELFELRETGWRCNPKKDSPEVVRAERINIQLQIQNYLSSAMACFSLALLGIPLGIRVSRSETFVNIGIALALALTFYMLTTFVSWIKDPDWRPDILVWAPNILYQIVGVILLRKAAKT